jgi:hypothetical protein
VLPRKLIRLPLQGSGAVASKTACRGSLKEVGVEEQAPRTRVVEYEDDHALSCPALLSLCLRSSLFCLSPHNRLPSPRHTMTAPALNAAISINDKVNGLTNGHPQPHSADKPKNNGVNGANGVNGSHSHGSGSIVKEAPFNTGRGRPLRVVCIGAGAAGIYLGLKLPRTISKELCELQVSLPRCFYGPATY